MFKNYWKTAWRSIWYDKKYTLVSIAGLSIGLVIFSLTLLFVNQERAYDQWDPVLSTVYRVGVSETTEDGLKKSPVVPFPLGTLLAESFPEVEMMSHVRTSFGEVLLKTGQQEFYEKKVIYADSNFFTLFPYHFTTGTAAALNQPNTVVLTKNMSKKLFGTADPMGKTINLSPEQTYTITGIIEKQGPSHLDFDICFSYHSKHFATNWFMKNHDTYIKLNPLAIPAALATKATNAYATRYAFSYTGTDLSTGNEAGTKDPLKWLAEEKGIKDPSVFLEAVNNIHLQPEGYNEYASKIAVYDFKPGNQKLLAVFSIVGILVLLLACINYTNITIAQHIKRTRNTGIRKVMGASKTQLILQYLTESFLVCLLALVVAIAFVIVMNAPLNNYFGLRLDTWNAQLPSQNIQLFIQLSVILCTTCLLTGLYPAYLLSRQEAVTILKGGTTTYNRNSWLKRALVITQYSIASCFIMAVIIITAQLQFMKNNDPGFKTDQVIRIQPVKTYLFPGQPTDRSVFIKEKIRKIPGVQLVSTGESYPGMAVRGTQTITYNENKVIPITFSLINYDYFETLQMPILQGRDFSPLYGSDSVHSIVLNETAIAKMGMIHPLGQQVELMDKRYTIIGVVKDAFLTGYEQELLPQAYMMGVEEVRNFAGHSQVFIKVQGEQSSQALAAIRSFWKQQEPEFPVRYSWLDEDFAKLLAKHERFGSIILLLTITAITIAAMGIFALSAFAARQRTKEIGIRKVLGSSVKDIVTLLSKEYILLVVIAFIIAVPIAGWLMSNWLQDFAYRIQIQWWMPVLAGSTTIIITLFVVGFQSIKAAIQNPVKSLRVE